MCSPIPVDLPFVAAEFTTLSVAGMDEKELRSESVSQSVL